jgi:hypothetical protein
LRIIVAMILPIALVVAAQWAVMDGNHPVMGPVRFAHLPLPIATSVGSSRVYSNAYVSCERDERTIAIELTNQVTPDDPFGLKAAMAPRLICKSPARGGGTTQSLIEARWQYNPLGDALARGLSPTALRACASIAIVERVSLPEGWERPIAPVEFEIAPRAKGLEEIFASCMPASTPAPSRASAPWRSVHTVARGHTNVRARPTLGSAVVTRLDPGAAVLVQRGKGAWWRAKSSGGAPFEGYIREDRLAPD